ncbi:MAG: SDR family oxidoreductase [Phycisphaerae bacterium]|nr:SDR family oxidoreductase [Phycisphaerae bacterium]
MSGPSSASSPASTSPHHRPVALVTGASAGIGLAFAELLAARQHDLLLVARRLDRLESAAVPLRKRGVRVETMALDLGQPGSTERLAREALARMGHVDVLVNNAGYGIARRFGEVSWHEHQQFLEVLLNSPVELTHRLLPSMRLRRFGRVINIASLAAFAPEPAGSLYTATKRFMVSFTRSLQLELEGTGVTATAVCPGFTYSEFHDVMGNRAHMDTLPKWLWLDAATVARIGLNAAEAGRTVVVPGAVNKAIALLCSALPTELLVRLAPRSLTDRHDRANR